MNRACHHCGRDVDAVAAIGRRDACLGCGADLHCCRNCRFYDPGYHNQCREPQAERQVDKEQGNFCEYFTFAVGAAGAGVAAESPRAKLEGLFAGRKRS